jgi:hypothetical protein
MHMLVYAEKAFRIIEFDEGIVFGGVEKLSPLLIHVGIHVPSVYTTYSYFLQTSISTNIRLAKRRSF